MKVKAVINRMETPELGLEMVQTVLAHPRDEVIGIGVDSAEARHPLEKFWKAYQLAGQRGLRRMCSRTRRRTAGRA